MKNRYSRKKIILAKIKIIVFKISAVAVDVTVEFTEEEYRERMSDPTSPHFHAMKQKIENAVSV